MRIRCFSFRNKSKRSNSHTTPTLFT